MERCDFASITAILRENLMDGSFENQIGFVSVLFEGYIQENEVYFDNGLLNRWLNGLAKVSPAIGQYYHDDTAHRRELAETLRDRILTCMADSAMAVKAVHALLLQDESVSDEKKAALCGRLCEVCTDYAEFLADVLVFGIVRRPFVARDIRKSYPALSESRLSPQCAQGNRKPCAFHCAYHHNEGSLPDTVRVDFRSLCRDVPDISSGESAVRMVWNVAHLNNMEDFERGVRLLFEMEKAFIQDENSALIMMLFSMLRAVNSLRSPSENHEQATLDRRKFEYIRSVMCSLIFAGHANLSQKGKRANVDSYAESQSSRGPPLSNGTTPFIYIICISQFPGSAGQPALLNFRSIPAQFPLNDRQRLLRYIIPAGRTHAVLRQAWIPQQPQERGFYMAKHADLPMDAIPLAAPYRRKIGKVTFVVSSFGNPKATDTAQQMLLRLLEEQVKRGWCPRLLTKRVI